MIGCASRGSLRRAAFIFFAGVQSSARYNPTMRRISRILLLLMLLTVASAFIADAWRHL
jgi:hypothetical protein